MWGRILTIYLIGGGIILAILLVIFVMVGEW